MKCTYIFDSKTGSLVYIRQTEWNENTCLQVDILYVRTGSYYED